MESLFATSGVGIGEYSTHHHLEYGIAFGHHYSMVQMPKMVILQLTSHFFAFLNNRGITLRLLDILLLQKTGFWEHKMFWKEVAAWTNAVQAIISKFSPTFQPHFRGGMPEDMVTCHHFTRLSTRMQKKKFHYFNILIHFLYCGILVIWNSLGPCPDSIPYEVFNCIGLVLGW